VILPLNIVTVLSARFASPFLSSQLIGWLTNYCFVHTSSPFAECLIAVDKLSGIKRSSRVRACSIGRGIIRKYPRAIPSAIWKLTSHRHLMDTPTSNQSITKSSNCEFMVGKPGLVAAEQLKWVASTDWRFYRRRAALRQYWRETWGLGNFFEFLELL
jgi:hypothetical protein